MNKQELSEKWSKYCDTDKLVDDVMDLLRANSHRCSEHGVCVLLDTYFTNKEPLIKLFITSKHYIDDMRIVVEKEFDRQISIRDLKIFFANANEKFHTDEMLEYTDSKGKTMMDYLMTGKTVFDITELPKVKEQRNKTEKMCQFCYEDGSTRLSDIKRRNFLDCLSVFKRYPYSALQQDWKPDDPSIPVLKAGTKTSRAFNKICVHYGVNKLHPETTTVEENGTTIQKTTYPYDKVFAEYADLVSNLKRKMQFVISLNPLDYLTMSNGINWKSCHNIHDGCYKAGTISYMLDTTSIITFAVKEINDDIHKIPKVYRQMYHYSDNLFVQSRLYPQGNDGATNLYDQFRGYVIKEFSSLLRVNGEWTHKAGYDYCVKHINSIGKHYTDYYHRNDTGIFYPTNKESDIQNFKMTVGHETICANCGRTFNDNSHYLVHRYECPFEF